MEHLISILLNDHKNEQSLTNTKIQEKKLQKKKCRSPIYSPSRENDGQVSVVLPNTKPFS